MCGIAGFINLNGKPLDQIRDAAILKSMAKQLAHRGPDDESLVIWENVGLAFRRLSIVDLATGQQPLVSEDGSILAICNGEIYNHRDLRLRLLGHHRLQSESDCEVLVHLYEDFGREYVQHLNGMFASAILDKRHRVLTLARDRLGIKPLFVFQSAHTIVFASEIKSIICHPEVPRTLDWEAALSWRSTMYFPHRSKEPASFFSGIKHLPAGTRLEIDLRSASVKSSSYWDPKPTDAEAPRCGRDEYIGKYRELLSESVPLNLMADVECGLFLSGGIDSVAVAAFAARHKRLHTFTVLSQSTITNGDAPSAHSAAEAFGLPNHQVDMDWRKLHMTPRDWRHLLWMVETPFAGAEQLYKFSLYTYAKAAVPGLKVMLLGSGSDEFNGGYTKAVFNAKQDPSWGQFERMMRAQELRSLCHMGRTWNTYVDRQSHGRSLISQDFFAALVGEKPYGEAIHGYWDMYRRLLQEYQLWHEDRTASAHGVENRVPFLDHRLVELAYAIPPAHYSDLLWDKTILREAVGADVPTHLRQRPKVPFFIGEDERYTRRLLHNLLIADDCALVEEAIAEGAERAGVFDPDAVRTLLANLPEDPEYASVDVLMELVNMGLLSAMVRDPPEIGAQGTMAVPAAVQIRNWNEWFADAGVGLARKSLHLSQATVLRFADGIRIARHESGDPRVAEDGAHYVIRNNELEFSLDSGPSNWVAFLAAIDGRRTVAEILRSAGLRDGDVWKHLEECIEHQVLEIVTTAAQDATTSDHMRCCQA